MDNEIKSWLFDIHSAIIEIESFFEEGNILPPKKVRQF